MLLHMTFLSFCRAARTICNTANSSTMRTRERAREREREKERVRPLLLFWPQPQRGPWLPARHQASPLSVTCLSETCSETQQRTNQSTCWEKKIKLLPHELLIKKRVTGSMLFLFLNPFMPSVQNEPR